jgi:hypothetical protein
MSRIAILFVTCCLEQTRYDVVKQVFTNIKSQFRQDVIDRMTVFDNGSTLLSVNELKQTFSNVFRVEQNVGYWSAIDWWLDSLSGDPPDYTYIIESDITHYAAHKLQDCALFLDANPRLGAMRLHEYSIENRHLYNKDTPVRGSKSNLWQSHTNKVTGHPVEHEHVNGPFWATNFLTQLPALNRYDTMNWCFKQLRVHQQFSELDFQRFYHLKYNKIAVLDGGMFNTDLSSRDTLTGSWTSQAELNRIGYQNTRFASITPQTHYVVNRVT